MTGRKVFVFLFFVMIMLAAAGCQAAGPSSLAATSLPTAELAAAGVTPGAPAGEAQPSPAPTEAMTPTPTATATPSPSPTSTPAPTATATPTATPTPIPTLPPEQVGGLSGVPDPRYSDPDLFDLTDPDAPIPQFVHAFTEAGIDIKSKEAINSLEYIIIKDNNDNPIIVVITSVDKFPKKYADLNGNYPLFIAKQNGNGEWEWKEATPRGLMNILKNKVGVFANPQYDHPGVIFSNNFNAIEPGAFSWNWVRRNGPDISTADFSLSDRWVDFALQNKMLVMNGNPLVYHHGLPNWLTESSFSKEELTKIMTDHIKAIVERYAGKGLVWEVLNEAVWYYQGKSGYEESVWYKTIGEEYIDIAFKAAREADPSALLIYNDFTNIKAGKGSNISGPKADVVFNFTRRLKKKGLIDGVGLQLHMFDPYNTPSEEEIISQIQRYKKIGVDVYFTEVTVNIKPLIDDGVPIEEALQKQAHIYQKIFNACVKTDGCKGIYIWGLDDRDQSWPEPNTKALLFSSGSPKLAFYSIMQVIFNALKHS